MKKFLQHVLVCGAMVLAPFALYAGSAEEYQLPDPHFEDWSGDAFDGNVQAKYWHASNVSQSALGMTFNFNFAHRETGRSGYCMMVQDQVVGAAGITETGPGYFSLGYGWQYLEGLSTGTATAGTKGYYGFTHRPDTISVWIKRTGDNTDKEDFHVLFYSWSGTAKGSAYKSKSGSCTSVTVEDEESDIRKALDGNQCNTTQAGNQIAEGWVHERRSYNNWTNLRIPIYYFKDDAPTKCNVIFSASNYPNFRANDGLYEGNSLYVDDVELIYASTIDVLRVGGKEWKGFDPKSRDIQYYSVPETATEVPAIEAYRGVGSLTNIANQSTTKTQDFPGRKLSGSEISIVYGDVKNTPTVITVKAEDGSTTTVYKIQFQAAKSSNTKLADIVYTYTDRSGKQQKASVDGFNPSTYNYTVELPYGTQGVPVVNVDDVVKQEDAQKVAVTQATSLSGKTVITVTADNGTSKAYNLTYTIGKLADNTLADIKVNGSSIPGFTPSQTVYKVSLPVGTQNLTVEPVSAYDKGEQTFVITPATLPTGEAIHGSTVQIAVTTPGNTVAKVYKLNIKLEASSYSYLADLQAGDSIKNFKPENTTYYVNMGMGTTSLPKVTWVPGDDAQTITATELDAEALDGTVRVTVTAGNGDQTVYKVVFATKKSSISTLNGIVIGNEEIGDFSPEKLSYTYALPVGTTTVPDIKPISGDAYQKISIASGGVNGKTRITVTAGDGSTTIYQIAFSVATFSDNTLKSLAVEGYDIQFDAKTDEYTVNLPQGTKTRPAVSYELVNSELQTANVRDFTGVSGDYKITVRPQSGSSRTYIIHFLVATSSNNSLSMIYIDGTALANFHADTLHYYDSLPKGVTAIPTVTFDKGESSQRVLSVLEGRQQQITVTAESGDKRTYYIDFIVRASENAFLEMIYLDGDTLEGFTKKQLEYTVLLKGETCPAITVDKASGQQVAITAPRAAGDATIKVMPGQGNANTYTIHFVAPAIESVQLSNILVDGEDLVGFQGAKKNYDKSYQKVLPTVVGVAANASQIVSETQWHDSIAWIFVEDTLGNKEAYTVTFHRDYLNDNKLKAIYADGVKLADFDPDKHVYEYSLEAGSTYPEITYATNDETQVVFFGQTAEGQWTIKVAAENGTFSTYSVSYSIKQYEDAWLGSMELEGEGIALTFDSATTDYNFELPNGAALPVMRVQAKPGQTVLTYTVDDDEQQVIVIAENGAKKVYSVKYTRTLSSETDLKDLLLDGVSIFDPAKTDYVDTLAARAKAIPHIYPVAKASTQTITTEYCRPNGTAKITVEAENGDKKIYTIAFPVRKLTNTALEDILLASSESSMKPDFHPDTLNYVVTMPYGATMCELLDISKGEPEQRLSFISRPLGQTSEITVTAENGDSRTYNILFKESYSTKANVLQSLYIPEVEKELKNLKTEREYEITLPYNARTLTVEYEKMFPEQTVFVKPGGVSDTTKLFVKSNRPGEADEVYNIIPVKTTQNPAILDSLKVDSVLLPDFDVNRFTYIVNRTKTKNPKVQVFKKSGVEYDVESDLYSTKITVEKDGFKNTYVLHYHYPKDVIPNGEFTESATTATSESYKPKGWYVTGDKLGTYLWTAKASDVCKFEDGLVHLSCVYWAALVGNIPAVMNLGGIASADFDAGSTYVTPGGLIGFHNTPDKAYIRYKYPDKAGDGALAKFIFTDIDGVEHPFSWKKTSAVSTMTEDNIDLVTDGLSVTGMDIIVDASGKYPYGASTANLYLDYIRFSYNSTPKDAWVNGIKAETSGKKFTVTLTDPEDVNIRSYEFQGQVSDQAQELTWGSWSKSGSYKVCTADIINYAEDGTHTDGYTLEVKRPLDTNKNLSDLKINGTTIDGWNPATTEYTYHLTSDIKQLPDVYPIPGSSLQEIEIEYKDSTMFIYVSPEKGTEKVYSVRFVTDLKGDVTLKNIAAEGLTPAFDESVTNYTITAAQLPAIKFEKQTDLQVVELVDGVLTVTAENGAKGTYTITRQDPSVASTGVITEFNIGDTKIDDFGGDKTSIEAAKPTDIITFTREVITDSVAFIQTPDYLQWNTAAKSYTYTYPTTPSSNAKLAKLMVNGEAYSEFNPGAVGVEDTCDVETAAILSLEPIAGDEYQTIQIDADTINGSIVYEANVTAQDGITHNTYKVRVARTKSDNALLAGILLDSVMIDGFDANTESYTVTLPSPQYKTEQPQIPSLTYVAGHAGQQVTVTPSLKFGEPTEIAVMAETGTSKVYNVTVNAEPSSCVDLTGIAVNGQAVDRFEPGRHFYSVYLTSSDAEITYTSKDNFQTVRFDTTEVRENLEYIYSLIVKAENGDSAIYEVSASIEHASSDAHLANITLDGKEFMNFERKLNETLAFDPGNNHYDINLPSGTTLMPEVSAQLKTDEQSVKITQNAASMTVVLDVTAADGSTNAYTLRFLVPQSTNANLGMIFLDGDSISNAIGEAFNPDFYFYQVNLTGTHELPEVAAQKGEASQSTPQVTMDTEKKQATIKVQAEDHSYTNTYVVVFNFVQSNVDTLAMIYQDGQNLENFRPDSSFYTISLPVGTTAYPELAWQEGDEWQTVSMAKVDSTANTLTRQIYVVAENGKSKTYTVAYTIEKSDVDTLQMLFIDAKQLDAFVPTENEYHLTLSAAYASELNGQIPVVEYIAGDEYQSVMVSQVPEDKMAGKSLDYKSIVTVTAATGKTRVYTIHYPVELSTDATLNMINLGGKPLANYDAERFNYKVEIEQEASIPVVSLIKKEEAQTYVIRVDEDTVRVVVWAESGVDSVAYTLTFDRLKSAKTTLRDIILTDANGKTFPSSEFPYRPEIYSYIVNLAYVSDQPLEELLPDVKPVFYDDEQVADTTLHTLPNGDLQLDVTVTAPNGEDQAVYSITFHFVKPSDATLMALMVNGEPVADFRPTKTEYVYEHPFGTDPAEYFSQDVISYMVSDSLAVDTIFTDEEGVINIMVTAQDGRTSMTYLISQTTGLDNDNALAYILIDGDTVRGFDPEVTFYTYYIFESDQPSVDAAPRSENADVDKGRISAGDTCRITCTAANGDERVYQIHFAITSINPGLEADANDVILKRVPGAMQLMASSIRNGVSISIFDWNGHLVYYNHVPVAAPNDADVVTDANNNEALNNVTDERSGLLIDILPGQPYFYGFYFNEKQLIKSGKIMAY